jgi:hypothetical protein
VYPVICTVTGRPCPIGVDGELGDLPPGGLTAYVSSWITLSILLFPILASQGIDLVMRIAFGVVQGLVSGMAMAFLSEFTRSYPGDSFVSGQPAR